MSDYIIEKAEQAFTTEDRFVIKEVKEAVGLDGKTVSVIDEASTRTVTINQLETEKKNFLTQIDFLKAEVGKIDAKLAQISKL